MMVREFLKMAMLGAMVFSFNTGIANAAFITGGMGITGNYQADATTLTLNTATGTSGTDDLVAVTFPTPGAILNGVIVYNAFDPADHIGNVLEINGGWQFDLSTLIIDPLSTIDKLKFTGTGILSGTGFDNTAATWTFSAQTSSSYSMSITAVPVPAAVWLFGSGLIGLVGLARKKV